MARDLLPYFNGTTYGEGLEGTLNYANSISSNFLVPAFLIIMYAASLYVWSKSKYKMGGGIFFISFVFFLGSIILQTVTAFSQLFIFIFFVGMLFGIVAYFIEQKWNIKG